MSPLVSVIIPCYNQAAFLPDAINSLKSQTIEDWECIIVNDGSTDNTAEVAEKLAQTDTRIRVINQENKGLSGARNAGLKAANSELLQFLDADDMLEKDKLRSQVEFLHSNSDIDIVFGDARYFTTKNMELREYGYYAVDKTKAWIPELWNDRSTLLEKSLTSNLFPINCPLVRYSVFNSVGSWNEDLEAHEDWEFWIRCAAANVKLEFFNKHNTLALVRMHSSSMTFDTSRMLLSSFKMRITVGPLIINPALRMDNFKKGLQALRLLKQSSMFKQLVDLAYANQSSEVFFVALRFYSIENPISHYLVNRYKTLMPWSIQKLFLNMLHIKVD